jgi:hypothetical protein
MIYRTSHRGVNSTDYLIANVATKLFESKLEWKDFVGHTLYTYTAALAVFRERRRVTFTFAYDRAPLISLSLPNVRWLLWECEFR